ncbi:hypothetical protein MKEN_01356900 [Mycena kentingensis (nom. inval.)]|nr:hypothetical protein MKEN_01356900 [Mycena kentingensis (nom. inval.)]
MRTLLATALAVAAAAADLQAPFSVDRPDFWDLSSAPSINSTAHLVFDTVASVLQHWPHTRYRNGHAVIPGTVPTGTLLYHGRRDSNSPNGPEWTATDPEHSYLFCRGEPSDGCWHLTLVNTRPLKVLYFDGSAAAKMRSGPMDTQDIVAWGQILPDRFFDEEERLDDLCRWGKQFGVDGFVRMQMDFEIMLCSFTAGLEVVARANLVADGTNHPPSLPKTFALPRGAEDIYSGSWHNRYPGDRRIQLDLTSLVSFYDTALVPSLVPARFGKARLQHRLLGIAPEDVRAVMQRLEASYASPPPATSGIDWETLVRVIVDRFADRLEIVQYILDGASSSSETAKRAMRQLHIMLTPYLLHSAVPEATGNAWAAPIFKFCATSHTAHIHRAPVLTPSERLMLQAVEAVNREICRVITAMWVRGVQAGLDRAVPVSSPLSALDEEEANTLIRDWRISVDALMSWLDWNVWVKCRPACGFEVRLCRLSAFNLEQSTGNMLSPDVAIWDGGRPAT